MFTFVKPKRTLMNYQNIIDSFKEEKLFGRYITLEHIVPILEQLNTKNQLEILGKSVQEKPIYSYKIGSGKSKILLWSQMHGNESTTTKALFDLLLFLHSDDVFAKEILSNFTLLCIPILNPDGAKLYTRANANEVDLNRDFMDLSQPESSLLMDVFNDFKPDFCYNLHDQRTIFAAGKTNNPATISFLAPAYNEKRDINDVRQKAINCIVGMNKELQKVIPNQVGRFDDTFNRNCVGDTFQSLGVPTILFEAGHFQKDYHRETTRKYIFLALLTNFRVINENDVVRNETPHYLNIPQNNPLFYDYIYRNVQICYDNSNLIINFAVQFKEELINDNICLNAYISTTENLENCFGHCEYDANEELFFDGEGNFPIIGKIANFQLGKNNEFVNSVLK